MDKYRDPIEIGQLLKNEFGINTITLDTETNGSFKSCRIARFRDNNHTIDCEVWEKPNELGVRFLQSYPLDKISPVMDKLIQNSMWITQDVTRKKRVFVNLSTTKKHKYITFKLPVLANDKKTYQQVVSLIESVRKRNKTIEL